MNLLNEITKVLNNRKESHFRTWNRFVFYKTLAEFLVDYELESYKLRQQGGAPTDIIEKYTYDETQKIDSLVTEYILELVKENNDRIS